jgi:hypothetical protein
MSTDHAFTESVFHGLVGLRAELRDAFEVD